MPSAPASSPPTGTAPPPTTAAVTSTWRASATTSPSPSPTPTAASSTATPTTSPTSTSRRLPARRPIIDAMLALAAEADIVVKHSGIGVDDATARTPRPRMLQPHAPSSSGMSTLPPRSHRMRADPDDPFHARTSRATTRSSPMAAAPGARRLPRVRRARLLQHVQRPRSRNAPSRRRPILRSPAMSRSSATACPTAKPASKSCSSAPPNSPRSSSFLLGGEGWGDKHDAAQRPLHRPRPHGGSQSRQLLRRHGHEHQPRLHGGLRLLAAHARLRSRRRRHLPALRRLARHRRLLRARHRDPRRPQRPKTSSPHCTHTTMPLAARIGAAFHARGLRDHTYAQRAAQAELRLPRVPARAQSPPAPRSWKSGSRQSRMKIVIFGLTITSAWGNGHATTYRSLLQGARRRGHTHPLHRKGRRVVSQQPRSARARVLHRAPLRGLGQQRASHLVAACDDADAIVIGSYFPDAIAATRPCSTAAHAPLLFYDIDTPITLAAAARHGRTEYLERRTRSRTTPPTSASPAAPRSRELETTLRLPARGALLLLRRPRSLPAHRRRAEQYRCDLSYLGTYAADRQPKLMHLLNEPARLLPDTRFLVAGATVPGRALTWAPNVRRLTHVSPPDHPAFYSSSRFTLNLTRDDMVAAGYSPSVRLFEASACGAAILSDAWPGLDDSSRPASRSFFPATRTRCRRHPPAPHRRRAHPHRQCSARERILADHTSAHRAAQFEQIVSSLRAARPRPSIKQLLQRSRDTVPAALPAIPRASTLPSPPRSPAARSPWPPAHPTAYRRRRTVRPQIPRALHERDRTAKHIRAPSRTRHSSR